MTTMDRSKRQGTCDIAISYIENDGIITDISPLVSGITWSGDLQQATRTMSISLVNTKNSLNRMIDIKNGRGIIVSNYEEVIFKGVIAQNSIDFQGNETITCYDTNWYLTKNSDSKKFLNKKASDIIKELCIEYQIPYGHIEDTGYVIPRMIFEFKSLWEIMVTAVTRSSDLNGRKFFITNKEGKLELRERKKVVSPWIIEDGVNLIGAGFTRSIENTFTQVKLISQTDGTTVLQAVAKNQALIEEFGLMQLAEAGDAETSQSEINQMAATKLKEVGKEEKTFDIESLGIDDVYSGGSVYVKQAMTKMLGGYYVISDNHTFSNGVHTMSLTLSLTDDLPRIDYEEPNQEESTETVVIPGKGTELQKLIVRNLKKHGIPTWIGSAIIEVESNFNPRAVGDVNIGGSYGLLQLYTYGQGAGYTKEQLFNPQTNLDIGLPFIADAYRKAVARGLTGWEMLKWVCSHSGHPSHTGVFSPGYLDILRRAYNNGDELAGVGDKVVEKPSSGGSGSGGSGSGGSGSGDGGSGGSSGGSTGDGKLPATNDPGDAGSWWKDFKDWLGS